MGSGMGGFIRLPDGRIVSRLQHEQDTIAADAQSGFDASAGAQIPGMGGFPGMGGPPGMGGLLGGPMPIPIAPPRSMIPSPEPTRFQSYGPYGQMAMRMAGLLGSPGMSTPGGGLLGKPYKIPGIK